MLPSHKSFIFYSVLVFNAYGVSACVCMRVYEGVSACCECIRVCVCVCVQTKRINFSQTLSVKQHIFTETQSRHVFNETFSHSSLLVLSRFAVFAHFLLKLSRWAHFLWHIQSYTVIEIFSHHIYHTPSIAFRHLPPNSDLVTPLKGHSLSSRSCPPMQSAPSKRSEYW